MNLGLTDRWALISGSYRGTGAGIAKVLAGEGARVLVHGFADGEPDAVVETIRGKGGVAHPVIGDIRTDAGAARALREARLLTERVDILINNYGVAEGGRWLEADTEEWLDLFQKNVLSGVRLARGLIPAMRDAGWGRIVWVGTIGSLKPAARMPAYYASKAMLPNLSVGLMKELGGSGITVNTISPGLIATAEVRERFMRLARKRGWEGDWEEVQPKVAAELFPNPTGRVADVREVGDLVAFVVSERAGYLNGVDIRIDGGAAETAI